MDEEEEEEEGGRKREVKRSEVKRMTKVVRGVGLTRASGIVWNEQVERAARRAGRASISGGRGPGRGGVHAYATISFDCIIAFEPHGITVSTSYTFFYSRAFAVLSLAPAAPAPVVT